MSNSQILLKFLSNEIPVLPSERNRRSEKNGVAEFAWQLT
jgi:hypothetical protein